MPSAAPTRSCRSSGPSHASSLTTTSTPACTAGSSSAATTTGRVSTHPLDRHFRDFRPPQLSTCNFFDVGTHGAMSGTYALKLATRPYPGHTATGIRRLTMSGRGLLQIEAYLAYKAEAVVDPHADNAFGDMEWDGNRHPSEAQFGAFTVATDLCGDDGVRYHTVVRYQNADEDGNMLRQRKYRSEERRVGKEWRVRRWREL